ncbi:hypothetical protein [Hyphomicrobium sp. 2TAF46]|uniref:hypothetical protein n=1 Tax=Hyphomicrobium sp. 2TAF46 TaxID=3233019 RepID=UPI003F900AF7
MKKILTVGLELASDDVENESIRSKVSLLDWDIILFRADISDFLGSSDTYQGKPSLDDEDSFSLKECCEHWRREIRQAVEGGKTVFVFLCEMTEVFVDSGQRKYSGTGRNRQTTKVVEIFSNYRALPVSLSLFNATGSAMKLTPRGAEILAPYWAAFGSDSTYKVVLTLGNDATVCVSTKSGDKPVGAIFKSKATSGSLILLPDIEFDRDSFSAFENGEPIWTDEAIQFSDRMTSALLAIDKALHLTSEATPEPIWVADPTHLLAVERALRVQLLAAETQVEAAQREKERILEQLKNAGRLRALLFEKGKPLEYAIIEALKLMGFQAGQYKQADSEFDVVFECSEGRLIGEAEGKDTKAVNIDKLRQLSMNIHEDLQREEISSPAKAVLFGNGFRLSPPGDREVQFTEKCISASRTSNTALVATSDLYRAAQYLSDRSDEEYAKRCRQALLSNVGPVVLPAPPAIEGDASVVTSVESVKG